jgi:hypothetical protein
MDARHFAIVSAAAMATLACSASSASNGAAGSGNVSAGSTGGNGGSGGGTGGGIAITGGTSGSAGSAGSAGTSCTQAIDIVFVMDVSTSMDPFLTKLAEEMPVVDQGVKALNLESPPHYGLVVFVDDTAFVNSGQPYEDIAALQQEFTQWAAFTSTDTQIDPSLFSVSMTENSMDALYRAAHEFAWRPLENTLRIVIHTTDDTFWPAPTMTPDGVQTVHDYGATLAILQQTEARVFSFASKLGGEEGNIDVSAGWFGPFQSFPSIPQATGGGVFELQQVLANQISLSESIKNAVSSSHCKPYPTPS